MSKLFNSSDSRATEATAAGGKVQLQDILETLRESSDAVELASSRLQNCRTIKIPHHREPLLTFADGEAQHASPVGLEAYRALRTRLVRIHANAGVRSIAFTSASQGEGKTLTVFNLAMAFAQLGDLRVLVVDADLRTGGLSRLFGLAGATGIGEVLEKDAPFENAIVGTEYPNLFVAPAGSCESDAPELLAKPAWKNFIAWCNEAFNLVLVDCTPILGLSDFELTAAACSGVLLLVRSHSTRREALQDAVKQLDRKKLLGIVYNGEPGAKNHAYYGYYYGAKKK